MSQGSPAADGHDQDREDAGEKPDITWVGQQWRMDCYCGRATESPTPAEQPAMDAPDVRPIAVVRTRPSQGRVVRIGPPRESNPAPAA